jgi:hypothetical protein
MLNGKIMEKMEEADKLLRQFPKGVTASEFAEKFGKHIRKKPYGRQTGYDYLNSLVLRRKAEKRDNSFYPLTAEAEKPSTEAKASRFGLFEWLDKRAERKRKDAKERQKQRLLAQIHYKEMLAESGPEWHLA